MKIERKLRDRKLSTIKKGVIAVNSESGPENSITVLKSIMQTASLVIPSPRIKLNSLGY